jgi:superfamily I DNA/RNA helicase
VFVRSAAQLDRARAAVKEAGLAFKILDEHVKTTNGHVSISTMHLAKGLEFRAVVVMACDDEIIPLQERIETDGDNADLQEVYDTERHLLYVGLYPRPRSSAGYRSGPGIRIFGRFREGRSCGTAHRLSAR